MGDGTRVVLQEGSDCRDGGLDVESYLFHRMVVVMYSGFCVLEGIILIVEKVVFGSVLIKKKHY